MKEILILRHGQTEGAGGVLKGKSAVRLSEEGRRTMLMLSRMFENRSFMPEVVLSSTIWRAIESAALLNWMEAPQFAMPAFDELDVGKLEGTSGGMDLDTYDAQAQDNEAETSEQAVRRVLGGLEMLRDLPSKTGLVLSHSILMMLLYDALPKAPGLPDMVALSNGSGYWIRLDGQPEIAGLFPENFSRPE